MEDKNWEYICPICGKTVKEKYTESFIRNGYIGATHDCPYCGGLLMIEDDLTCSDFGEELVRCYDEMGVKVSKEEATGSYITIK